MREREGRTLPFVGMSEGEGVALASENKSRLSTMSADEADLWDELHIGYHVDHSEIYSDHGKHTNMAESYFYAFATWSKASTTMQVRSTFTSMRTTLHGMRTTAAPTTVC